MSTWSLLHLFFSVSMFNLLFRSKTMSSGAGNPKFLKSEIGRISGERLHPSKNVCHGTLETEN